MIKKPTPQEDQVLWKFSIADSKQKLEWEHSREFEYKDEMYDVIRSEQRGDTIWYWCYWDRKETRLKKQIDLLALNLPGPGTTHHNHGQQIHDFFKTLFFPVINSDAQAALEASHSRCTTPYHFTLTLHGTAPPAPPPWII